MWCLFRANVSKPGPWEEERRGRLDAPSAGNQGLGGLTKIDTDRTFVDLISHIGYGQGESWN
jgi:hypothetical protein